MLEALICGKDWLFKEKDVHNEGEETSVHQTGDMVTPSGISLTIPPQDLSEVPAF
ncbi:unnamed protein product, partial [Urochloa humidicola]